ncbi:Mrp/NBP35 family ATP-binding protein [Glutamicibacter protophormiae]|uniref:Iron-sulfur cluster carrier protein n=1 Tax=Kocuria varians TaxID=1272 RepID=A0A7D7PUA1_KOCVA|nr:MULTISPECIES: Mrp/NBP35 family ATP-binding protein [Kocuria]WNB89308.1 Mrp/NBP35 family ATP-binding protein [Glutamicibacter protophormiae]MDN5631762.1 Mrp/NBP35 family ATP-binding protein [Kocuria sp.]QMS57572.1 Iron-sulfur cluster carrier protein [Kocuria varians]RUP81799.1 MRP family ATP-binding protein [Kocuria sp. HSID17590]RUQ05134.1 MRP family ATP-binding protein [Kocuria sp. HSID17582]
MTTDDVDPRLRTALDGVLDPELRRPVTELGMIPSATLEDGTARVTVLLTVSGCPLRSTIESDLTAALREVPDVTDVTVDVGVMTPAQRQELQERLGHHRSNPFADPHTLTRVHAVTSGKGGVGKSSVTVNLAAALAAMGRTVGIVDADIHGFSVPGLLGITQSPTRVGDMILPPVVEVPEDVDRRPEDSAAGAGHRSRGVIKVISIGMFVDPSQPVAWRGPMLHRAVEQFLTDVHFGDLDHLLLDLPPGTGDIAISVGQLLPRSGVVVVSTPQHAAVSVAQRSGTLAEQTEQRVTGVVENMSAMVMPDGTRMEVFGSGGGETIARSLTERLGYDVPLLGSVPLDVTVREASDRGVPAVWANPDSPAATALWDVARALDGQGRGLAGKSLGITPTS